MSTAEEALLSVVLVYAPKPRSVVELSIQVPRQCTVAQALALSGIAHTYPEVEDLLGQGAGHHLSCGIWGRKVSLHQALSMNDRIEIYRGLLVDPKTARRERFKKQGARVAGLFAKRRAGAKAGY